MALLGACGGAPAAAGDAGAPDAASASEAGPDVVLPPNPIVVVTGASYPYGVGVDDQYVYFTSPTDGTLARAPKLGGAPEVLATGMVSPHRLALDDAFVYVVVTGTPDLYLDGQIVRIPKSGGAVQTLATGLHLASGLALDDGDVYFVASGTVTGGHYEGDGVLARVKKDGSAPFETLLAAEDYPALVTLDAGHVYWTARFSGLVVRCDKADCKSTRTPLYGGLDEPVGIAVAGSTLVFAEYHGSRILAGGVDGAGLFTMASSRGMPLDLVTDGTTAYWGEELTRQISFEPIQPYLLWATLATADKDPTCLALDAHAVYVTDEAAGTITRVPR